MKNIWASSNLTINIKIRIFNTTINKARPTVWGWKLMTAAFKGCPPPDRISHPFVSYGAETWRTAVTTMKKIQAFISMCLRRITRIRWPETINNREHQKHTMSWAPPKDAWGGLAHHWNQWTVLGVKFPPKTHRNRGSEAARETHDAATWGQKQKGWVTHTWGRYHGGRRPSSDEIFRSPTVIQPSTLDKPSIMKCYHRWRTCSHTSPRRSPTMVTLHYTRFVECRWWNDGWTMKTVVTWRLLTSLIPAPGDRLTGWLRDAWRTLVGGLCTSRGQRQRWRSTMKTIYSTNDATFVKLIIRLWSLRAAWSAFLLASCLWWMAVDRVLVYMTILVLDTKTVGAVTRCFGSQVQNLAFVCKWALPNYGSMFSLLARVEENRQSTRSRNKIYIAIRHSISFSKSFLTPRLQPSSKIEWVWVKVKAWSPCPSIMRSTWVAWIYVISRVRLAVLRGKHVNVCHHAENSSTILFSYLRCLKALLTSNFLYLFQWPWP